MADISAGEGLLEREETHILKNLLRLRGSKVTDIMTPRTVIFSLPEDLRVEEFFWKYESQRFSRIPIYADDPEHLNGFVLRSDLLLAQASGNTDTPLANYRRELHALPASISSAKAFDALLEQASREADAQRRLALLTECERIIVQQDVPLIPLCQYVQVYMYDPGRLTGLSQHPRLTQYLWQMKVHER